MAVCESRSNLHQPTTAALNFWDRTVRNKSPLFINLPHLWQLIRAVHINPDNFKFLPSKFSISRLSVTNTFLESLELCSCPHQPSGPQWNNRTDWRLECGNLYLRLQKYQRTKTHWQRGRMEHSHPTPTKIIGLSHWHRHQGTPKKAILCVMKAFVQNLSLSFKTSSLDIMFHSNLKK